MIPTSLYVHLPWCARKCPYCDFNSHAARGPIPEQAYVDALARDLAFELRDTASPAIGSIFFGGGTPSLFSGSGIARILDMTARHLAFAPDIEITLEANPGTADAANFRAYRRSGVNRLSIGVQSLDDAHLRQLGRIHGRDEAIAAVGLARDAGFDNVNLDLMFALPGQSCESALGDLDAALRLSPEHLSWYHLTIEPNTEFAARPPVVPDADAAAAMHDAGTALLASRGFAQYETSAFATSGRECRHNLNYWTFGDYLGIGAGAHAKRTGDAIQRRARHKHPRTYMESAGRTDAIQEQRALSAAELPFEFCMNALRLHRGFTRDAYVERTGLAFASLDRALAEASRLGLVTVDDAGVTPTERGRRHQNRLFEVFL